MTDRLGEQLGNYRLLHLIGRGGFAEVYLGEHIHLNTQAAIKVLHAQLTSDDAEKFLTEARTIARLVHPHIVRVLEYGIEDNTPYLVLDYASNGTLRQRHPKGVTLPLATIVNYIEQISEALQYAHDQKLVHRDIKPENMLVGRGEEILLADFGLALVAQSQSLHNMSNSEMAGTVAYMAPEQFEGKARPASDQYSLGIVVYEWLCGDQPFQGTFTEMYSQHLHSAPPSLREKNPSIPLDVEQVVMKALHKDPQQRFVSVRAFAHVLELASFSASPLLAGATPVLSSTTTLAPSSASEDDAAIAIPAARASDHARASAPTLPNLSEPPSPLPFAVISPPIHARSLISRRRVIVGLAGLVTAGTAVGGIAWWKLTQGLQTSATSGRTVVRKIATPTSTASPAHTLGSTLYTYHGHSKVVFAVTWSPEGKRIASGSGDATVQIWDAAKGHTHLIYKGHSDVVNAVAWSPDGRYIASGSNDKTVQVWDANTGKSLVTYHGHSDIVRAVTWAPAGQDIASGGLDRTIQIWQATTGTTLFAQRSHTSSVNSLAWSPDGRHIASAGYDQVVHVWNATASVQYLTLRGHFGVVNGVAWSPDAMLIASGSSDATARI